MSKGGESKIPPKKQYSKDEIVEIAFQVARDDGLNGITIRKVAEKLGSSIAPIYVNFKDIEALKQAVVDKVFAIVRELYQRPGEKPSFMELGIASLRFAREYSAIYRDLVMQKNNYSKPVQVNQDFLLEQLSEQPEFEGFTAEEVKDVLFKISVFQLGLSVMAANNFFESEPSEEELIGLLMRAGEDLLTAVRCRKGKS